MSEENNWAVDKWRQDCEIMDAIDAYEQNAGMPKRVWKREDHRGKTVESVEQVNGETVIKFKEGGEYAVKNSQ